MFCALDRADDLRHRDAELGQLIGLDPQPHRILAGAEYLHAADARHARELVVEIDVGVVGQKLRVVSAVRRIQADQHQRRGQRLLHRDAVAVDLRRKLRCGERLAHLRQDQIGVRIRLHVEIHDQSHLALGRGVQRIHVVHVVHAAHLLFDGRGDGLLDGLRVRARVDGRDLHFRRSDLGNRAIGSPAMVTAPTITIRMEITIATMGRLMKNLDMAVTFPPFPPARRTAWDSPACRDEPSARPRPPRVRPASILRR